jgi:hypothetical protein
MAITVVPVNYLPVASGGEVTTNEDTPATGTLLATDTEGSPLTYSIVAGPSRGTITALNTSTGQFTYAPPANASGVDSFTFRANDGAADSNVATISIVINAVNDAPAINSAAHSPITRKQGTAAINSTVANVSDVESTAGDLSVTALSVPDGITVGNIVNTNGVITADVAATCAASTGDKRGHLAGFRRHRHSGGNADHYRCCEYRTDAHVRGCHG